MIRKVLLALAVGAVLAPAADGTRPKVIAERSASGRYAIVLVSGRADDPHAIFARVRSKPRQRVDGTWTVACGKRSKPKSTSGEIHGRTPLRRRLRLPVGHPSDCSVSATAQLERSGRITLQLLAR